MKSKTSIEHKEIAAALIESTRCYFMSEGQVKWTFTNEKQIIGSVCSIESLTKELISSNVVLFKKGTRRLSGSYIIVNEDVGQRFISSLAVNERDICQSYPLHEFSPNLELFFKATAKHKELFHKYSGKKISDDFDLYLQSLNECVTSIRTDGKGKEFTKKLQYFQRLPNKNFLHLKKYIDSLFEECQRLLVIRVDFGYLKGDKFPASKAPDVKYLATKNHREKLQRYIKEKLPTKSIVGFAWKLHYSLINSFQYSFILFSRLNVKGGDDSELIARLIGDYWSTVITNGQGLYYSGAKFAGGFKRFGVGIVNFDDTVKRSELVKAAIYLTKKDFYLQFLVPENGRSFGKGGSLKK